MGDYLVLPVTRLLFFPLLSLTHWDEKPQENIYKPTKSWLFSSSTSPLFDDCERENLEAGHLGLAWQLLSHTRTGFKTDLYVYNI